MFHFSGHARTIGTATPLWTAARHDRAVRFYPAGVALHLTRTPMFNRLALLALALALPLSACNDDPETVDTDVVIEDVDPSVEAAADDAMDAANAAADAAGDAADAAGDAAASAGAAAADAADDATDAMEAEADTMGM